MANPSGGKYRKSAAAKRRGGKLRAAIAPTLPATVPTRWVKSVVAVFLLVPAWILTQTFFSIFARTTVNEAFWATEEFWFFGLGCVIWASAFFLMPRPVWVYVVGHEFTHAIWVWFMGGRVSKFRVAHDGGFIISDRINTWIALAPYFFPVYSIAVIVVYGLAGLFVDLSPFRPVLFMLIGATWAFHVSFTLWMIPKGQSDLAYGGNFFSLVVIYLLNLVVLSGFLIAASPSVTAIGFLQELVANAAEFAGFLNSVVRKSPW